MAGDACGFFPYLLQGHPEPLENPARGRQCFVDLGTLGHMVPAQLLETLEMKVSHVEVSSAHGMGPWSVLWTPRIRELPQVVCDRCVVTHNH